MPFQFQENRKFEIVKQGFIEGFAWETQCGEWETNHLNFSHLSVLRLRTNRRFELLLYSFASFHSEGERIWYGLKPWKSPHLPALRFHSNSRLSVFLPSCFPFLNLYKYWQNFEDSVEVSLNPNSSCAPFFFLMLLFPFLHFVTTFFVLCVDDCYAEILFTGVFNWSSVFLVQYFVLWCGWLFWLLRFLIGALSYTSIDLILTDNVLYELIVMKI